MIDVKALQYTTPTALTRATKPFSIKRVSRNSRAALCQCSLPFSVCRCPLLKYHGQTGSSQITYCLPTTRPECPVRTVLFGPMRSMSSVSSNCCEIASDEIQFVETCGRQNFSRLIAILPSFTTSKTSRTALMSSSGLRSRTIRSASRPGRTAPVRFEIPKHSADLDVAA